MPIKLMFVMEDMKRLVTIIVVIVSAITNCHVSAENRITYPYYASKQRSDQIRENYNKIKTGLSLQKVKSIMGLPDEEKPLYEPRIYKPKQIGYSHWYLIQRKSDKGSIIEKDEKLVRVLYDLQWKVIQIDHWGFD